MTVCGRIRLRVLACIALALGVAPLAPFCGAKAAESHALAMHGEPALPRDHLTAARTLTSEPAGRAPVALTGLSSPEAPTAYIACTGLSRS